MKKKLIFPALIVASIAFLHQSILPINVLAAVGCVFSPSSVQAGGQIGIITTDLPGIHTAYIQTYGGPLISIGTINGGTSLGTGGGSVTIPTSASAPAYQVRVDSGFGGPITCADSNGVIGGNLTVTSSTQQGTNTDLGTITPPTGIPNQDPTLYISGVIRNGIRLLLVVAFITALLWTIFAGFRFVTSGGDEKTVGQSWSSIYWGIVGMLIVMGSYAIVRLVEIFFQVNIISGAFTI